MKLDVPIPEGAEERAHRVAMSAFASHRPTPRRRSYWRPAVVVVAVAAAAGVLASPPGRSVIHALREAVGVKKTQRELLSLPAPGRILLESPHGAWVVNANGSRRLLGNYREVSWSPFGRFVVGATANELVALEPNGKVHWTLPGKDVHSPRWGGLRANTRIAYLAQDGLHVVAGDGSGDRLLAPAEKGPFAWRPGFLAELAYISAGNALLEDTDSGLVLWRSHVALSEPVRRIAWSADGSQVLLLSGHGLLVLDARGQVVRHQTGSFVDATFIGRTHNLAILSAAGAVLVGKRLRFLDAGLRQLVSSPDGRWLLATWPVANHWVFIPVRGRQAVEIVISVTRGLGVGSFPVVAGWIGK